MGDSGTLIGTAGDWRDVAACSDTDPELFFPIGTTGMAIDQIESAKEVCTSCRVQDACLTFALKTNQDSGVWGGLSEEERRIRRRAAKRAKAVG
ncbi:MAG: WhiB family transcriptional regulator [Acidimicrobiales bacterium]